MLAAIAVENPERAAAACAALAADRVPLTTAPHHRPLGVTIHPLATALTVEQVIETACRFGFHAEEVRHGVVEFWIGEWAALELLTPESTANVYRLPLAA